MSTREKEKKQIQDWIKKEQIPKLINQNSKTLLLLSQIGTGDILTLMKSYFDSTKKLTVQLINLIIYIIIKVCSEFFM